MACCDVTSTRARVAPMLSDPLEEPSVPLGPPTDPPVWVLVGGVGQLFQSDLDFGRRAAETLAAGELGSQVRVEELHYGGVAVAQLLQDLRPAVLVLVGAAQRGDTPGTLRRRHVQPPALDPAAAQLAIGEAVTGYVGIDLVVEVAASLDALPDHTVAIEVEPAETGPSDQMSDLANAGLTPALAMVRAETRHGPQG